MARRPFRPAVDTGSYFPASAHQAALAALAAAFARRDPVALLDGPPGTGKSLVARRWLEHLPSDVPRAILPAASAARPADLLQAMLFDLEQPYQGLGEQELRLAVTACVLAAAESGHPLVLLIDEAQHLGPAALEELRLLGNIETGGGSAVFAVLVAQPTLGAALAANAAFAQRVAVRCRVDALTAEESAAYLRHQVTAAGGKPGVFDEEAVAVLAAACGGVARVLNRAATLAAELAAEGGGIQIDAEAALEALARLGLEPAAEETAESVVLAHPGTAGEPAQHARGQRATGRRAGGGDEPGGGRGSKQKAARKRSA
jgi:type II secretory pathway predicted ATPase ExeA